MKIGTLGTIFLLGLSLGLTGCGYSCEDLCEDAAECSGSTTNPDDCDPSCEIQERINDDFGCDDEFDEFLSCASEVEDVCDEDSTECDKEGTDYIECIIEYCADHPSNDDCGGSIE